MDILDDVFLGVILEGNLLSVFTRKLFVWFCLCDRMLTDLKCAYSDGLLFAISLKENEE
jgi:hypothetical protein